MLSVNVVNMAAAAVLVLLAATSSVEAVVDPAIFDSLTSDDICVPYQQPDEDCIPIGSWTALRQTVQQNFGRMVLCPFTVVKTRNDNPIIINRGQKEIVCAEKGQCTLSGFGRSKFYIVIKGAAADLTLQGFDFTRSTGAAIRTHSSSQENLHKFCDLTFNRNWAFLYGVGALKVADLTSVAVARTYFFENWGEDSGAIDARGNVFVIDSKFKRNTGKRSGAILSARPGKLALRSNDFAANNGRGGAVFYRSDYSDLGGNTYSGVANVGCNGATNGREKRCYSFDPAVDSSGNLARTVNPNNGAYDCSPPAEDVSGEEMPQGYYNYNPDDTVYGPSAWQNVFVDPDDVFQNEWLIWPGLNATRNYCNEGLSSPIRLEGLDSETCPSFHDWRHKPVRVPIDFKGVRFSVTPAKVRIDFKLKDIKPSRMPEGDFPGGFGKVKTHHVEVSSPSEHTLNGVRFDAEYVIAHLDPKNDRLIYLAVLVLASAEEENRQFQILLDEWAKVTECTTNPAGWWVTTPKARRRLNEVKEENEYISPEELLDMLEKEEEEEDVHDESTSRRTQAATFPQSDWWNIYHWNLMPSFHFFAYEGSQTFPPCLPNTFWRILDQPMEITPGQLSQLQEILNGGPCDGNEFRRGFGTCNVRPLFERNGRDYWHCGPEQYRQDCVRFDQNCPQYDSDGLFL